MTLLAHLVDASARVAASAARLTKVRELAEFLKVLPAEEIETAVHYLSGETPQGRIGIGTSLLQAAASTPPADHGTLSIAEVDQCLSTIAGMRGAGTTALRVQALRELFARATSAEHSFLLRLMVGELRQGALAGVMVDGVAAAAGLPVAQVRRAAMYSTSLGALARAALVDGIESLGGFQLHVFTPVSPMLAKTAVDVAEALGEMPGDVAFEWKMDGARIQVHKVADEVRIYTRGLNEVTDALPEIVDQVRRFSALELVLDGEAIAYTMETVRKVHAAQSG